MEVARNPVPVSSQDPLSNFFMKLKSATPITFVKSKLSNTMKCKDKLVSFFHDEE